MAQYIKRLKVLGLHRRFDLDMSFEEGVNIVHGVNGAGKTTMLHILANVANLDLPRFAALDFHSIRMEIVSGPTIEIYAQPSKSEDNLPEVILQIDGHHAAAWPLEGYSVEREEYPRYRTVRKDLELLRDSMKFLRATYFPAFRTMSEAWSSRNLLEFFRNARPQRRLSSTLTYNLLSSFGEASPRQVPPEYEMQTELARELFGQFVPQIGYPSPREIQRQLDFELQRAFNRFAGGDSALLSETFRQVFSAISQDATQEDEDPRTSDSIRAAIGDQLTQLKNLQREYGLPDTNSDFTALQSQIDSSVPLAHAQDLTTRRVLRIYERALDKREKNLREAFETVWAYIDAVNQFFGNKQLVTAASEGLGAAPTLKITHSDGVLSQFDILSSGERQIASLIYSASRLAKGTAVLVDEPELSLHIDWQRKIVKAMVQQLPSKQLIICTHSPVVGVDYEDQMKELVPQPTKSKAKNTAPHEAVFEDWDDLEIPEEIA